MTRTCTAETVKQYTARSRGKEAAAEDVTENIKSLWMRSFNRMTTYTEAPIAWIQPQLINYGYKALTEPQQIQSLN